MVAALNPTLFITSRNNKLWGWAGRGRETHTRRRVSLRPVCRLTTGGKGTHVLNHCLSVPAASEAGDRMIVVALLRPTLLRSTFGRGGQPVLSVGAALRRCGRSHRKSIKTAQRTATRFACRLSRQERRSGWGQEEEEGRRAPISTERCAPPLSM